MLSLLTVALALIVWGAHGTVAPSLAQSPPAAQRLWRLAALPAALAAVLLAITTLAAQPDVALAAGFGPRLPTAWPAQAGVALVVLALLGDGALLLREPRTTADWRLVSVLGAAGAAGGTCIAELARIGAEPTLPTVFVAATLCRLAISLGAGEVFTAHRPRLGIPAALALGLYLFMLPERSAVAFVRSGHGLTLLAAVLLFASARWLPLRLRRPAILGAALLAAVVLWRAQTLTAALTKLRPASVTIEGPND